MKNILGKRLLKNVLTFGLATVAMTSCSDDLLEQSNNNATSSSNFGSNANQIKKAVNAAVHPLNTAFLYGRVIHVGAFLRDDSFNIIEFAPNTDLAGLTADVATARWASEAWEQLYKSIGRANTILEADLSEGIPDEAERNALLGQAYFIRAFDYWHLVNLYGNVPLVLGEPDLDNLFVSQSSPAEIYPQIIEDFRMAEQLLPASWDGADIGRPTSGAAAGFLGKTYLYNEQWAEAEAAFRRVVDGGQYSLLPGAQYGENFGATNENNSESVFEMQFNGVSTFLWGQDIAGTGTQGHFLIEYAAPNVSPDRGIVINPWVRGLFDAQTPAAGVTTRYRRNESLLYDYPGATGYAGEPYLTDYAEDILTADRDNRVEPIFVKKYAGHDLGTRAEVSAVNLGQTFGNNWRVMRYSDVLLMLAEAINEQNRPAEAAMYLNMVRTRAGLAATTAADQASMETAIIEERAMELLGEGHRFFDLVRWGLADEYLGTPSLHVTNGSQTYHPKSLTGGSFIQGRDELIFIPINELQTNPSLNQNPGY